VDEVGKRIKERTKICEDASQGEDYVVVIPFRISHRKGKNYEPNAKFIIEPILSLKSRGFRVVPVYLRNEKVLVPPMIDALMQKIAKHQVDSNNSYEKQASELENLIRTL
jgi:hypothetical protein